MCTMLRQTTGNESLCLAAPRLPILLSSHQLDETSMGDHFVRTNKLLVSSSTVKSQCETSIAKISALLRHERGETQQ